MRNQILILFYCTRLLTADAQVMGIQNNESFLKVLRRTPPMDSICQGVASRELAELNRARADPAGYGSRIGVDLTAFKALPPLQWDSLLSRVAQLKAEDMRRYNYVGHHDKSNRIVGWYVLRAGYPLANPFRYMTEEGTNVLESCAAFLSTNPRDTDWISYNYVRLLIHENGAPNERAGHRLHLLGRGLLINNVAHPGTRCGIGVAPGRIVILIADRAQ